MGICKRAKKKWELLKMDLVGRSAVDCCQETVNFFSTVPFLYTFFSASTGQWKILKKVVLEMKVS